MQQHSQYVWAEQVLQGARAYNQKTGQYLFNHLPGQIGRIVRGTLFDPFNKDLTVNEVHCWIQEHLIFDGYQIIALFNGNDILWDEQ